MSAVLFLLACSGKLPERELSVADGIDVPEGDSFVAQDVDPDGDDPTQGCGGDSGWAAVDAGLELDWCVRLTPELGSIAGYAKVVPPPCGFANLVGSLGLGGTPAAPALLYCDADTDGGTRVRRYDPVADAITETMLSAGDCSAVPGSGDLAVAGEGALAAWAGRAGVAIDEDEEDAPRGLSVARIGADGAVTGGPALTPFAAEVALVAVADGDPPMAIVVDGEQVLWAAALDDSLYAGAPVQLAAEVGGAALVAVDGGHVVATCAQSDGPLELRALDTDLRVRATVTVEGAACGWFAEPDLVATADGVALAWEGALGSGVARFDADLQERWRYAPADSPSAPQVLRWGEDWLVFTADGALSRLDDQGAVLTTRWHPGMVDAPGSIMDLRLLADADRVVLGVYGMDVYAVGGGHVNTYNYVELSSAPIP